MEENNWQPRNEFTGPLVAASYTSDSLKELRDVQCCFCKYCHAECEFKFTNLRSVNYCPSCRYERQPDEVYYKMVTKEMPALDPNFIIDYHFPLLLDSPAGKR